MSVDLYCKGKIPADFPFPDPFIEIMSRDEIPYFEPWWFLAKFEERYVYWVDFFARTHPTRTLVPFAKFDEYPEIACFGLEASRPEPLVYCLTGEQTDVFYAIESWDSFEAWLEGAKRGDYQ